MATRGLSLVNVTPEPRATVSDSVDWRKKYEELEKSLRQKHDDLDKNWRQKHESLDKNWRQKQDDLEKNLRSKQDKLEGELRQRNQETNNSWQKKYNDMESRWHDVHEQARTQYEGLERELDQTVAQNKKTEGRLKELDSKHSKVILEHGKVVKDLESSVEKRIREGIDQRLKAMEVKYKAEIQALQAEVSALKSRSSNPNLASHDLTKRHGEVVEEMRRTIDGMKKREAELNQQIKREQSSKETFSQLASDLRTKLHEHESGTKGLKTSHLEAAEKLKKCKTFTDKIGQMMDLCSSDPVFESYPSIKQNFAKTRDFAVNFGKTLR